MVYAVFPVLLIYAFGVPELVSVIPLAIDIPVPPITKINDTIANILNFLFFLARIITKIINPTIIEPVVITIIVCFTPVVRPIITSTLEVSLSLLLSSTAFSLLLISIFATFSIFPTLFEFIVFMKTIVTSLLSPTPIFSPDKAIVYNFPSFSYQFGFNSEWNSNPSGILSTIIPTFPSSSPLLVTTILYSKITVAPFMYFEFISTFANFLLL